MRKIPILIVLICSSVFIANSHKAKVSVTKKKPEPVARWTGTLSRVEKIIHSNQVQSGTVERRVEVSFNAAMPTMNRDDGRTYLDYTDDKGSGIHTEHGDMTNLLTKQKCVWDCTGSGKSELHTVIIREWDNTYDIEAISPVCHGTDCDGKPFQDQITITVSNETFTNRDILSGSKTVTAELAAGLGTATSTTIWHLRRVKEDDVELIVTPQNYDTWLPEPGKDELTKGSMMTVNLKLQGINGKPLKAKAESFELTLNNTSTEPGITINYPIEPDPNQLPDLRFLHLPMIESADPDQFISVSSPDGINGKTYIGSYDGGGWTILKAEAILTDGRRVQGKLLKPGGEIDIRIPKRDPNSHIGEAWLKKYGNPGEMDDKEVSNGNNYNGDGLTAYEEYRGVISEATFGKSHPNKFGRLDPHKKELGIYVIKSEQAFFKDGITLFESASDLTAILFDGLEIDLSTRRLNNNGKTNHYYNQYVLWLFQSVIPGGRAIGKAYGGPGTPKATYSIVIDIAVATKEYQYWTKCAKALNVTLPFTLKDLVAKTIAHEIGHGVNCWHHGLSKRVKGKDAQDIMTKAGANYQIIRHDGSEVTTRPFPIDGFVGEKHSDESGNISCFMIYQPYYRWSLTVKNNQPAFMEVPLLPLAIEFCNSGDGTGINEVLNGDNDFFANGKWGNCLARIKLMD